MSHCRFSDDNFRCDLYAYEDARGHTLHVAASRLMAELPPDPLSRENMKLTQQDWSEISQVWRQALNDAPSSSIDLPGAGEAHHFATLRELRDKIAELTALGFHAPHWLIPQMDEELREKEQ